MSRGDDAEVATLFHNSFRYIDDTLSVDNPLWQAAVSVPSDVGGMYPRELILNDTTPADHTGVVHFLGMDIMGDDERENRFRLSVYDKRDAFAFPVRRYPHMESLIPPTIPYGVFLGQLHRGYRICSQGSDFVAFACDVAKRLVANGCRTRRLLQLFVSFVKRSVSKYTIKLSTMTRSFRAAVFA